MKDKDKKQGLKRRKNKKVDGGDSGNADADDNDEDDDDLSLGDEEFNEIIQENKKESEEKENNKVE